ncbi:MAG: DUF5654 family protein [Candidatus Pacearchaeota archaeon]
MESEKESNKLTLQQKEEIKKEIQKEIQKKLTEKIKQKAKESASEFKREFKKQIVTAISGAFAFLIALTWRTPIEKSVNNIVKRLNLNKEAYYYEYIAAIIITILGVIAVMLLTKWATEKNKK